MSAQAPLPSSATGRRADEVETLSAPIGSIRLLLDADETGGALSTQRVSLVGGADGAPPHRHERSTELFAVLAGRLQMLVGEELTTLQAGDVISVGPGVVHAFGAAADADADVLIVITPGVARFEYFRTLGRIVAGDAPPDALVAEQDRYDTWFDRSDAWEAARRR